MMMERRSDRKLVFVQKKFVHQKYSSHRENYGLVQRASVLGYCCEHRDYTFGVWEQGKLGPTKFGLL